MKWEITYDQGDYGYSRFTVIGSKLTKITNGDFINGIIVDEVQIDIPGYIESIEVI